MISEFTLQNLSTLETVKFGQDFNCDYIYESGGLDWGNVPATHNVYNYPNQIGDSISSTKVNNRDITIEAYVFYSLTDDEREETARGDRIAYAYEKIKVKKEILNRLINPLNFVRMTIGDYYIDGKPSATPQYGVTEADNNIFFCKFLLTIFCANPMFKKLTQTVTAISSDVGFFHFPFSIPNYGYVFGLRNNYLMLLAENEGNVEIGGKIIITAKATIVNPSVENISNGHIMKIKKTMTSGEVIVINTADGSEKGIYGEVNGELVSYLQYWDFTNDWMKFEPGESLIGYSTDNQAETSLDVKIEINPAKYGLEEM